MTDKNKLLRLLAVLYDNPIEGNNKIQKIFFIVQKELNEDFYNFEKDKVGPVDKTLYMNLEELIDNGFVETEKSNRSMTFFNHEIPSSSKVYSLTEKGKTAVANGNINNGNFEFNKIREIVRKRSDESLKQILKYIDENYEGVDVEYKYLTTL